MMEDRISTSVPKLGKTMVFCTSFATTREVWESRYRRWLRAIKSSQLDYDFLLIVDDGSPVLPDWRDTQLCIATDGRTTEEHLKHCIFHFSQHLGRKAVFNFPGWYRSFAFAGRYAAANGFSKVVHIESDSFLIGPRIHRYFNKAVEGWTALWCPRYQGYPESAIQIIAGQAIKRFANLEQTHPHESLVGREFELQLPFDVIERKFKGDRYGEYLSFVPGNADYVVQALTDPPDDYYWWMERAADNEPSDKVFFINGHRSEITVKIDVDSELHAGAIEESAGNDSSKSDIPHIRQVASVSRLIEEIRWTPVHGASVSGDQEGSLIFYDGDVLDWHLIRWNDPRLDGARVRLSVVVKPTNGCSTNFYVQHWSGIDLCSIDKNGNIVLNSGLADVKTVQLDNDIFCATIIFDNRHSTLSIGSGKPAGHYRGTGEAQFIFRSIEVEVLPLYPPAGTIGYTACPET